MKRHTEAVAWDRFAAANLDQFDSSTLGQSSADNRYLRNRLQRAFEAGIEFQKRRYKKGKSVRAAEEEGER